MGGVGGIYIYICVPPPMLSMKTNYYVTIIIFLHTIKFLGGGVSTL